MQNEHMDSLIDLALSEDFADRGDVTSKALIKDNQSAQIYIVSRSEGIFCGKNVAKRVFEKVDSELDITFFISDGDKVVPGTEIAVINGKLTSILSAERTVLNFIQHLSGVATLTRSFVDSIESVGSTTKLRDTRKTLPGYRVLEKQAVVAGGGINHRQGLFDAFLVKDNHLAGIEISQVVEKCRAFDPELPLEVEVDNIEQLKKVVECNPDLILLDNFSINDILTAKEIAGAINLEVSGGVTLENLNEFASTNVTYIAVGAITHSAKALDIGFDYHE